METNDHDRESQMVRLFNSRFVTSAMVAHLGRRVWVWRINHKQDRVMNYYKRHQLPSWFIFSSKRMVQCRLGDRILLHASGGSKGGIYAEYIVTHGAVKCALAEENVCNYFTQYQDFRGKSQCRVAAGYVRALNIRPELCRHIAHHMTPHLLYG